MKPRLPKSWSKSTGVFAPTDIRRLYSFLLIFGFFAHHAFAQTQLPECTADVPFFNLDLSASPDMSYTTPEVVRQPGCCGDGDNYISFYVILNPNVAQFEIVVAPGYADPGGSGNYNIISGGDLFTPGSCGTQIPGGTPICITGSGPHKIIYSKPGKNKIKYIFRQIPKPIFPADQSTRIGCSLPLSIFGLNSITITSINSSTGNTTVGAYNSLLSCTNCSNPSFSPGLGTPSWIDYKICGTPQAAACGTFQSCDTVRLYTYGALSLSATPNPATFCQGGSGVLLTATASGGNGTYTYRWLNSSGTIVSNTNTYTATVAGTYTAEVTDGLSTATCPDAFVSVPVTVATTPVVNAGVDQVVCATSPTVLLQAVSTTGSGIWSGGSGTFQPAASSLITSYAPSASEINNGSATLTFTSTGAGGGCINTSDQMTVLFSDTVVSLPSANPIACYNGSTTINVGQMGGTAPYSYSWSTGSSANSISVTAGTYLLTVTDQYGCADMTPITINQPNPLALNLSTTTANSPTCDGTATVAISGGTAPYSVLWSNGQTTATAGSLCEGIVSVTVTDNNGCSISQSAVINDVFCNAFDVGISSSTNVSCHDGTDGSATVSVISGGTAPFSYSWNTIPVQTGATASNLTSGTYAVTVTDNLGCQDIVAITILQPTIITNTMTHVDASSIGGSDGSATANPLGGTPGYTYLWSPGGQTTQTATNLSSAVGGVIYQVAITDANSCLKNDSVRVNQPPCNDFITSVNPTNVSCSGSTNGAAALVIANGTAPFSISWSNGVNNAMNISNLASGNYTVTVTDSKNCSTFSSFSITQPAPLSMSLVPTNISCNSAANGTIDLTASGGTYPYTFSWSHSGSVIATHEDLTQLAPGTYSIVVTDAKGCSISGSIGIMQPAAITTSYTYSDNPCYGNALGSVDLTVAGGSVPYGYAWTGPSGFTAATQNVSGLNSGLYQVTITDLHGCSTVFPVDVFINQPVVLSASASMSQQVSCNGGGNGAIALTAEGGTAPYSYAWTGPSSYSSSLEDISGLMAGTYNVNITDAHGCSTSTSATVTTVVDVTPPIISCIANQSVFTNSSAACTYTVPNVSWNASASDNCLLASLTYTLSGSTTGSGTSLNGVAFNKGVTTVTWVATDGSGNTATCSFTVMVTDNISPVIMQCGSSAPASVLANSGVCTYTNSGTSWNVVASDNCAVTSVSYSLSGATTGAGTSLNGVVFNLGVTTVTWTVMDAAGNTATCSSTVIVSDNQLPAILSCGATGTENVLADAGVCTYTHSGTAWNATASDNCSVVSVTYTLSGATSGTGTSLNGVVFNPGTTTVTWKALDGSGNFSTCSFNVIVGDNQNPVISNCSAIGNQVVNANTGLCTYTHNNNNWNAAATDNCTVSSIVYTLSGATAGAGTSLNGVQFNLGVTTVAWVATDATGNTTNCAFTVTVNDAQVPVILSCGASGNQVVNSNNGVCTFTQTSNVWNASASDNCSVASVIYVLTGATSGTGTSLNGVIFNLGLTTVTWTATDGSGNTAVCTFNVLVTDKQIPVISSCGAPGNQAVVADVGQCTYTNSGTGWDASATDNCSVASVEYVLTGATTGTGTSLAGVVFNLGTTTVTWTVTDGSGNSSSCTFNVVVSDNQLPVIVSCGATGTQNVVADAGGCTYTHAGTAWDASATDNCSIVSITYTLSGATSGTGTSLNGVVFNQGTTLVTWKALDGSGNFSICTFNVIVGDDQDPVISNCSAIGNQVVNANTGLCSYTHNSNSWNAIATDNCTVSSIVYTLSGATTGSGTSLNGVQFNLGVTTVTWVVTDAAGNTTSCIFTVTVHDTQVPVILSCGAVGNQSVVADAGQCSYTQTSNTWNASANDNCSVASVMYVLTGATIGTGTSLNGVAFNLGTTTVTWAATDGSGNTSTCAFNVLVSDTQLPVISSCGASGNQSVSTDAGVCTYTQTGSGWNASATDNCTVTSLTYTLSGATIGSGTSLNGVVFNQGITTVTWTAVDIAGNQSQCQFTVTVTDDEDPVVVNCPSPISQNSDPGDCGAIVSWVVPSFTDNCGATISGTETPGSYFPVGVSNVSYTVVDNAGNSSSCLFSITITDAEAPVINCPDTIATCDPLVTYSLPTVSDNCGVLSMVQTTGLPSGSIFPVGVTINNFVVTDIHGNVSNCLFTVRIYPTPVSATVVDQVSCNGFDDAGVDLQISNGTAPYQTDWSNSATSEDLSNLSPGTYTVAVTDNHGCTTADTVIITEPGALVIETAVTHLSCYNVNDGSIQTSVGGGTLPYTYSWLNGEQTSGLSNLEAGYYDLTVTDANGCILVFDTMITEPDSLTLQATVNNATCNASNGSIQTLVAGGTTPYGYDWSNGSSNQDLNNVPDGSYNVVVTDAHGCQVSYSGVILSVTNLSASAVVTDVSCYGHNNGEATVIISNGNQPYVYTWSTGGTSANETGLTAGSYSVQITDEYGCTAVLDIVIGQPDSLVIDLTISSYLLGYNVSTNEGADGSIVAVVSGGTPLYSYFWSTADTTNSISNLTAGEYLLNVTDGNGCIATVIAKLRQPDVLEMPQGFSPNDDGDNDYFVVHGIKSYPDNTIKVFNRWGNIVYQKDAYADEWYGENTSGDPLPDATYFVILEVVVGGKDKVLQGYVDLRRK